MAEPTLAGSTAPGSLRGLSDTEAGDRRARGHGNDADTRSGRTYFEILRENAFSVVNILLLAIAGVLVALDLLGDAAVTAVLVIINVVVGVFQEGRAKRSLDRLSILTKPTAIVIRDGAERTMDPTEAVLGDLMVVRRGDQLLLDGRVVAGEMEVDESLLTGEADRIPKKPGDDVLSGSFCVTGSATYEATKVGADSFANQLTAGARAFREDRTPIQRDVARVMRAMSLLVAITAVPVAIAIWVRFGGLPAVETARAAAVLVALVPQGLVVMVTVTYALAIVRLAGDKALIQRSSAVESMSRVDVLCLDKTGTLTTPNIELASIEPFVEQVRLDASLGGFVASASQATRSSDALRAPYPGDARPIRDEVAFSSELRWSGLTFSGAEDHSTLVMGAPEVLRPKLTNDDPAALERIGQLTSEWASQGLRVMMFVEAPQGSSLLGEDDKAALPDGLRPLALFALREQLRPDAMATLARFRDAGVMLKLISGDNPETVAALSRQVGLTFDGKALSGLDLVDLDDAGLVEAIEGATVFGRVPPSLKARLVLALRSGGHWVAMVGDGVNDVLSLKQAHLGISMQSGSQATRAVADIVLLDDSFSALPEAVIEGQRIITGMQDSLHLFLARALYMSLVIFGAALLGDVMPVSPRHNTVLALITVGIPALFLAAWARPSRPGLDSLRRILRLVIPPAVACAAIGLPLFAWYVRDGDVGLARTTFTTFAVVCGLGLLPLLEPPIGESMSGADADGADWRPTALAIGLLALYALFFIVAPVRDFFELTVLRWGDIALVGLLALAWALLVLLFWRVRMVERVRAIWHRATH
ncbi:MAG: HAD-IC family P-type ATPase [Candidatus Limnocylindrales bacterium]